MRKIPLTQGKYARVDDQDYDFLNQWKWRCNKHGRSFRAIRTARTPKKRITILMHRQILNATTKQEIDHWDGNDLNNQRVNLRKCNRVQNCANAKKKANCSSIYKGVTWDKRSNKWLSQIMHNYKNIHLGYFLSETEAALAYDKAARKHFGEFARLNFPE